MGGAFKGFSPQTLSFFESLSGNNQKAWFEAHRAEYDRHLLQPLKDLVSDLAETVTAIDPELVTIPAVDKTISRIYRDTRFSRDKSPYKTCLWITFKRQREDWKDTPCFFFEIRADGYRYGMGFYSASRESMDRLRSVIEQQPARFRKAIGFLGQQERFQLEGEMYRRPVNPSVPADLQPWHQRKNLYLVCDRQADHSLFTPRLCDELREGFVSLAPLYQFLWQAGLVA